MRVWRRVRVCVCLATVSGGWCMPQGWLLLKQTRPGETTGTQPSTRGGARPPLLPHRDLVSHFHGTLPVLLPTDTLGSCVWVTAPRPRGLGKPCAHAGTLEVRPAIPH